MKKKPTKTCEKLCHRMTTSYRVVVKPLLPV